MKLIVTRPQEQARGAVAALRTLGVDAVALPLIAIGAVEDAAPLHAAWAQLGQYSLVMFVSANAVQHFFAARPVVCAWPAGTLAGSTGPGTSAALFAAEVPPQRIAEPAAGMPLDSESLWAVLRGHDWRGREALIVRGEEGRDWLADALREAGARVGFLAAYRRTLPRLEAHEQALLDAALVEPQRHLWLFSSSEAVGNLRRLAPQGDWRAAHAAATHARIATAAREAGFGRVDLVPAPLEAQAAWVASLESAAP